MNKINQLIEILCKESNIKDISIENGFNMYLKEVRSNRAYETYKFYKYMFNRMLIEFNKRKIINFSQLNNQVIQDIVLDLKAKIKPASINKQLTGINTVINYLVDLEIIDRPNIKIKKLKEDKVEIKTISKETLSKIINYLDNKPNKLHYLAFMLMIGTGLRRTELVNIKTENIDLAKNRIYLEKTKTANPRYIYLLDQKTIDIIKNKISDKNEYLFSDKSKRYTTAFVDSLFNKIKKELRIDVLSPHKLRHTYGTMLLENGASLESVRLLLGHKTFEMTKRYVHLSNKKLENDNSMYNPLNCIKKCMKE